MENHVEANIEEYKNIIFEDELSLKNLLILRKNGLRRYYETENTIWIYKLKIDVIMN
ncbi:hypothetical protein X557_05395 [Francisella tularensis subsp. holarctica PHIT-FT049]|nr:hypothetical protein X557_05395 [Francisella tularensis subsp. holarctica PHIT-FT049]